MIPLIETNGQQTNFGPYFWKCVTSLNEKYGKHWLPVSSGTAAVQLACQVRFRRGDRIAVPDFTMIATLQAVVAAGCVPVVVACDHLWGQMRQQLLRELVRDKRIDGAVVVSPFGAKIDPETYECLGIPLVYDLAGAWPQQLMTCNPVAYSCHATKNISTREGGMLALSTEVAWNQAKRLSCFDLGHDRIPRTIYAGNYKMDEERCERLYLHILHGVDRTIDRKRALLSKYAAEIPWAIPLEGLKTGCPSLAVFRVPDAEALETAGAAAGVIFKRYYFPLLTKIRFDEPVEIVGQSPDLLQEYIAFPSDVNREQFFAVVNFAKRFGDSRGWRAGA